MDLGLTKKDLGNILIALKQFSEIKQAVIFGSRAKLNHEKGSDVDLAIKGKEITNKIVNRLSFLLNEEVPLPYFFDVVHYEKIKNKELKGHITRIGKVIYSTLK